MYMLYVLPCDEHERLSVGGGFPLSFWAKDKVTCIRRGEDGVRAYLQFLDTLIWNDTAWVRGGEERGKSGRGERMERKRKKDIGNCECCSV